MKLPPCVIRMGRIRDGSLEASSNHDDSLSSGCVMLCAQHGHVLQSARGCVAKDKHGLEAHAAAHSCACTQFEKQSAQTSQPATAAEKSPAAKADITVKLLKFHGNTSIPDLKRFCLRSSSRATKGPGFLDLRQVEQSEHDGVKANDLFEQDEQVNLLLNN